MAKIRTRARAVDMLGRQQIATIQNAIAELFKNAYDAYAKKVQVDYMKNNGPDGNGTLLIRDNGFGMTKDDFENKWLVLGTESKVQNNSSDSNYVPPGETPRKITGEKGIGRLAIALLGRQVVVFTRARRYNKSHQDFDLHDLVVTWIHWGLFEIPGINLEDIEFPVKTYPGGTLPDRDELEHLRAEFIQDIQSSKAWQRAQDSCIRIIEEIKSFNPILKELDAFLKNNANGEDLSLIENGCGTTFFIGGVNRSLPTEIAIEDQKQDCSFRQLLLGFIDNTFDSKHVDFHVSFKVWEMGAFSGEEYLGAETFFTKDELVNCTDHFFSGEVDQFGQCKGTLRVYAQQYDNVIIPWKNETGHPTECGTFRILFGALQGNKSESVVAKRNEQAFWDMYTKLNKLGGIYMYRDGIRILPYGLNDFDWLDIEKRRTLGASYYYFSYRRMIGAVLLSNPENNTLQEKAGREGFQKNVPYQQLRSILMNILIQLASDFFRTNNDDESTLYEQQKNELAKEWDAYIKKQKQSNAKRKKFAENLDVFWKKLDNKFAEKSTKELLQKLDEKIHLVTSLPNPNEAAIQLISIEQEALQDLDNIRNSLIVRHPMGVGLPKHLQEDWQTYQVEFKMLDEKQLQPCRQTISHRIGEVAKQAKLYIDQRKRLVQQLDSLIRQRRILLKESSDDAKKNAAEAQKAVLDITSNAKRALEEVILNIQTEMNSTPIQTLSEDDFENLRKKWELRLTQIENNHQRGVDAAKDMLSSLTNAIVESGGESAALAASALEKRVLDLEEQANQDFEMVQLGIAIAIIEHEFTVATKEIQKGLHDLNVIVKQTSVRAVLIRIQSNFEYLDGLLKLFTPLQRRIYRKKLNVSGADLKEYAKNVFSARFLRHNVFLESSPAFDNFKIKTYPSTIFPVIINLIDNAIYWLSTWSTNRKILLDAMDDHIIVANNGPKIELRDEKRIFERGFSRKPGGRGLGLFISMKALAQESMNLQVVTPPEGYNTAFGIFKTKTEGENHDN